jgi:hypothetical protein
MATLRLDTNNSFSINTTVRESDPYSESVFIKFEMEPTLGSIRRMDEMFLTPDELDRLGRFFIRQASEISMAQAERHLTERIRKNPNQG